jgi:type I restriction enzyme S subunit
MKAGSKKLPKGSVIASCVGSFGVASINTVDVIINQQLQAYIPGKEIDAAYLRYCVSNMGGYFEAIGTSSTIVYVNQQGFDNLPISLPALDEQMKIVNFLDSETTRIDTLISKTERSIVLLKERRSALITAAVTGQIDLREAV